MRRLLRVLLFVSTLAPAIVFAGPVKMWVTLRDKGPMVSKTLLLPRAYEDAPVYGRYLEGLRGAGFAVSVTLKWQNRVSGWADSAAIQRIAALSYVTGIEEMPRKAPVTRLPAPAPLSKAWVVSKSSATDSVIPFGAYREAFDSVGATALFDTVAARGLRAGEGLRIAVIDENFSLAHHAFDSLYAHNAIVDQWNFVDSGPVAASRVLGSESHGAWTLSLLAANMPGTAVGLVPYAKFLLYRTEIESSESVVEEDYLAAALERAVDSGAQVVNISLGYRYDFSDSTELPYSSMNGRTRPSSLAALGAARRGVLVVVAAGNEGGSRVPLDTTGPTGSAPQPTITAPADADSIVTVGMMRNDGRCGYSSTGPTFDGRLKPEISSIGLGSGCGVYLIDPATVSGIHVRSGTSFGAPTLAGIAALLRQLHPDTAASSSAASSQKIRQALMVTGNHSGSPDNQVGNGLARAVQAHCALQYDSLVQSPCHLIIPSVALKGPFVWRGGLYNTLAWPAPVDLSRARLWDLQGRYYPIQGSLDDEGAILLQSRRRLAPGTFILKIPAVSAPQNP